MLQKCLQFALVFGKIAKLFSHCLGIPYLHICMYMQYVCVCKVSFSSSSTGKILFFFFGLNLPHGQVRALP